MKVERWGMLRWQFVIHKYNWVERRLVFDQAREASKRTEPDSFNYFLELIFFSVGKEIQDRDSPTSSWKMLGTAFSSEGGESH